MEQPAPALTGRVYSLDAFRGFTMVWMFSQGFGLLFFLDHPALGPLARQFTHAEWRGVHAWDMIQPFFMFIVGAAMPFSFGRRWAAGETWGQSLRHVLKRAALLVLCGLAARSVQAGKPVLDLINVLAQLAFTYPVAFLVLRRGMATQGAVALALLAVHWALYQFVGAPGVAGPWVKDANIGWYLDRAVLGKNWGGSYATINCLSSAANTILGVMAGRLLGRPGGAGEKLRTLLMAGAAGVLTGLALDPAVPLIKKIWTASFAIYSGGWTLLAMALFFWLCDVRGWRRWAHTFAEVGMNSIFIYLFHEVLRKWLNQTGLVFTGWAVAWWGDFGRMLNVWLVVGFQIYLCRWLYRRKIFFKL